MANSVLIVGANPGLSAALACLCTRNGMAVALAAHNINKREAIFAETDASQHLCDASDADQVASLFAELDNTIRTPDMVVYNPSARVPGPSQDFDPHSTKKALDTTCHGAFW